LVITLLKLSHIAESEKSTGVSAVNSLKSTNATLEETISRQKLRIETLETSHKDTLTLLEKKSGEFSRSEEEYKQLQTKHMAARREISNTETALQEAEGQISTLTYKTQSLQQEVEFLRKDHDRVVSELNAKATYFSTYRKEKVLLHIRCIDNSLRKSRSYSLNLKKFPPLQIPTQNKIVF
jgi:chromosome segregation ATPase